MTGPHPDPLDPMQNLEPAATGGLSPEGVAAIQHAELGVGAIAALSQAISLKRIADTLDQIGLGNPRAAEIIRQFTYNLGREFGAGIEEIAFSIGQQIRRGSDAG